MAVPSFPGQSVLATLYAADLKVVTDSLPHATNHSTALVKWWTQIR
jgi:hypothetical protein